MERKDPKPVPLHDWPNYIVTEYLGLSTRKADTLELLMKGKTNNISTASHPVIDKAMDNSVKEGIGTLLGLYALSLAEKYPSALYNSFKKDSAFLISHLKNGARIESDEEVICALILNSLGEEEERMNSLQRIFDNGEKPSKIIEDVLTNF